MAFWSGEKLIEELGKGNEGDRLIEPFEENRIACAAYTLSLGGQAFVTEGKKNNKQHSVISLEDKKDITIPPGQFAFLLTKEEVTVPNNAIAFISMRAKYKFKGLINVSGFHVDPGWKGHLVFGVYNAGPADVSLAFDDHLFLIWYSDLGTPDSTGVSKMLYQNKPKQDRISSDLLNGMQGQIFSPLALNAKINELNSKLNHIVAMVAGAAFILVIVLNFSKIFK